MSPNLIALYSPAMGMGKGEVTKHLHEHGFATIKMADPLKNMLRVFLTHYGIDGPTIERGLEGDLKETVVPGLKVTYRHLMQTIGKEWGRDCVDREIWIKIIQGRVSRALESGLKVVVDDLRYPNEYDALWELGAHMIKVYRPGIKVTNDHYSEGLLNFHHWHGEVYNDGTLEQLQVNTERMIELLHK